MPERLLRTKRSLRSTKALCAAACLFLLAPAHSQDKSPRLTFDVASIRASEPGDLNGGIKPLPGGNGYIASNFPLKLMISLMYKVPMRQITGPAWIETARYNLEARADKPYSVDDLHTMVQNLLADRFALRFHIETKQGPVYALTVDPAGLKMKPNTTPEDFAIPMNGPPQHAVGKRVPLPYLCWYLGQVLQADGRPVIDKTGLTGSYDFTLSFLPEQLSSNPESLAPGDRDLPSLFIALKEQLGLRLQRETGPVPYYVIDHIEPPSAN